MHRNYVNIIFSFRQFKNEMKGLPEKELVNLSTQNLPNNEQVQLLRILHFEIGNKTFLLPFPLLFCWHHQTLEWEQILLKNLIKMKNTETKMHVRQKLQLQWLIKQIKLKKWLKHELLSQFERATYQWTWARPWPVRIT